jgi:hypothetical protein
MASNALVRFARLMRLRRRLRMSGLAPFRATTLAWLLGAAKPLVASRLSGQSTKYGNSRRKKGTGANGDDWQQMERGLPRLMQSRRPCLLLQRPKTDLLLASASAAQLWAKLAIQWYTYELGADSEVVMSEVHSTATHPETHPAWGSREPLSVGPPLKLY